LFQFGTGCGVGRIIQIAPRFAGEGIARGTGTSRGSAKCASTRASASATTEDQSAAENTAEAGRATNLHTDESVERAAAQSHSADRCGQTPTAHGQGGQMMDLLKNHYEKLLLSLMLIGLAAAVWFLYQKSVTEEEAAKEYFVVVEKRKVKGVSPVDLSPYQNVLKKAQNPPPLVLAGGHNVFNPVKWQRRPDGTLLKIQTGREVGPEAMTIARVTPLYFIINLDKVANPGYIIGTTRENAERPIDRRKKAKFYTVNAPAATNDFFTLKEIKGPPEDPTELILELADTKERVSIAKGKDFKKAVGYEVDLKYPVENKDFKNLRIGSTLTLAGDQYIIVAISENEVVLSARLNDKKYTVRQIAAK
jgi:hypothetical protein